MYVIFFFFLDMAITNCKLKTEIESLTKHIDSQGIDNINFETEYRREWCSHKGKPSPCFLFARKFTRPAALRLLREVNFSFTIIA